MPQAPKIQISIIGAGIAGPVFALQILSHPTLWQHYSPIIYDKLPPPSDISASSSNVRGRSSYAAGAAVALTSNALFPLYELGLRDALHEISSETTNINIWRAWSGSARVLGDDDVKVGPHKWYNIIRNPGWKAELGTNLRVVERRELQRILLERLKELGSEVVWGKKLIEIEELRNAEKSLKLVFEDGTSVTTDLVVGGDGNWSSVRKFIIQQQWPDEVEARWKPKFPFCSGIYGVSDKFENAEGKGNEPGDTHWVLLGQGVASTWALPDGKMFWTISLPEALPPVRSSEGGISEQKTLYGADVSCGGYTFESTAEILRKHENIFHPFAGNFGAIFANSSRIVRAPLWHKVWDVNEIGSHNAVVIGDASRAMLPSSGQGACFAIEDATVLANSILNNSPTDYETITFKDAISEYVRFRVPRSKRMATQSYWTGVVGLAARFWWRWLRDFGSAWFPLGGDPRANTNPNAKDPMGWLHDVRYRVE
ncbi:FAD/NAD(P)-binding domain-containing protein [Cadophora sp. DSE1049]|nr:FAD/NAD(P)-binding domain-containing protein [Cadophora sp. DSE1049]